MSLTTETATVSYNGNNSTVTAYPVPFKFYADSHLVVKAVVTATGVETILAPTSGFTVTGAGADAGGSIRTVAAWNNTHTILIQRQIPFTQLVSFSEGQRIPNKVLEKALDWAVMQTQRVWAALQTVTADAQATLSDLVSHKANVSNPHAVTKAQVGLGNVSNLTPADLPVSMAQAAALTGKETAGAAATAQAAAISAASTDATTKANAAQAAAITAAATDATTKAATAQAAAISAASTDATTKANAAQAAAITAAAADARFDDIENSLGMRQASGTITVTNYPSVNQTMTIGGQVYTFKNTNVVAAGNIFVDSPESLNSLASKIRTAINSYPGSVVTATVAGNVVTIQAVVVGVDGNSITLSTAATGITLSGAALTGGGSNFAAFVHTHAISDIVGLAAAISAASTDATTKANAAQSAALPNISTTEPSSPFDRKMWFHPITGELKIYYAGAWVAIAGSAPVGTINPLWTDSDGAGFTDSDGAKITD